MNLDALKKRFAEIDSKNKKGSKTVWKPEGEHNVRLLPLEGGEDLAIERYFHFNIGNNWKVYCPRNDADECAICTLADALKAWKDENGVDKPEGRRKSDFNLFRKIEAGPKHFAPVIVRRGEGEEYDGPFLWEMSGATYKQLLKICINEDYNDDHPDGGGTAVLTSIEHGRDLKVRSLKPGEGGNTTSFKKVELEERKKTRKLLADSKAAKQLLLGIPDIGDAVKVQTTKEVARILEEFINSDGETAAPGAGGDGVEHGGGAAKVESHSAEKLTGTKSVEEGMAKLTALIQAQGK